MAAGVGEITTITKNPLRWVIKWLPLFTAAFVTLFVLTGWLAHQVFAAPVAALPAVHVLAQAQVAVLVVNTALFGVSRYLNPRLTSK